MSCSLSSNLAGRGAVCLLAAVNQPSDGLLGQKWRSATAPRVINTTSGKAYGPSVHTMKERRLLG